MADGALSTYRVLELGDGVSAAYCTKLMADLGAEVIKIEAPGSGDSSRAAGPFPGDLPHPEKSGLFLYLNTNKLSITLNLGSSRGRMILHQLVKEADILVENLSPAKANEYGLTYQALEPVKPKLIVTSITPYGLTGPYRDYKGYPINTFHGGGAGYRVGEAQREPLTIPGSQTSYTAGISAAGATMCALLARNFSGLGQQVDISEMEMEACFFGSAVTTYSLTGGDTMRVRPRLGHRLGSLNTAVRCKDGYVHLIAMNEAWWSRLVEIMGNPEWARDRFFQEQANRDELADELEALLEPWLMEHTKEELFELGIANRIPVTPYYTTAELDQLPHLKEREFFVEIEHPVAGNLRYPGAPYKFSETPWAANRPAPILGQHNEEIYCNRLGYTPEQLSVLRTIGVI